MTISTKGIELIKRFEGCSYRPYTCPSGVLTIGYGHTGQDVHWGLVITQKQAEEILRRDLKTVVACIDSAQLPSLSQGQYDALCSFVFNVGCGAFIRSTLLKKVRLNPNDSSIRDEFRKWVWARGKVNKGLEERREAESQMYFGQ